DFVHGSVLDKDRVERLFGKHRFVHVFHLAGFAAERLSHYVRRHNYEINVIGSANLVNASVNHGVDCFVYTSSAAVYGRTTDPATEDLPLRPIDPYGIAKMAVERDLAIARERFGLDHVVLRPHNIYGERQSLEQGYRNVVGIFIRSALEGKPMPIYGDGDQCRPFTYVSDVAPIVARAPFVPGARNHVFNVGADLSVSILRLAQTVSGAVDVPMRLCHLDPCGEADAVRCAHEKVRLAFDLANTEVALEEGVSRMARWARSIELRRRLEPPTEITPRPSRQKAL